MKGGQVSRDPKYTITKPDGTPFHWSDFCEGWADAPIRLRRERDARHAVAFLKEKFGAASWISDVFDTPPVEVRERVPTFVDELDARLALWIAESQAAGEES
jgi:hypothetical protein